MAEQCTIDPSRGKKLYKTSTKMFGHSLGTQIFLLGINPKFTAMYKDSLSVDSEGVPLFHSLLKNKVVKDYIGEADMIKYINNLFTTKKFNKTDEGFSHAIAVAKKFKDESEYSDEYVVYPIVNEDNYSLAIRKKDDVSKILYADTVYSQTPHYSLQQLLNYVGLPSSIDSLASFLGENERSIKGLKHITSSLKSARDAFNEDKDIDSNIMNWVLTAMQNSNLVNRAMHLLQAEDIVTALLETNGVSFNKENITNADIINALSIALLNPEIRETYPIIQRIYDQIKQSFQQLDFSNVNYALDQAIAEENQFMTEVIENTHNDEEDLDEQQLIALEKRVGKIQSLVDQLLAQELKRQKIFFSDDQSIIAALDSGNILTGLTKYLGETIEKLKIHIKNLELLNTASYLEQCNIIKNTIDYARSYGVTIELLKDSAFSEDSVLKEFTTSPGFVNLKHLMDEVNRVQNDLLDAALPIGFTLFSNFIRPILGDNVTLTYAGEKRTKTLEELLRETDSDISVLSRWLDSAANSNDVILKAAHSAIKKKKGEVRFRVLDIAKKAKALGLKAEANGLKDFTFMYKVDESGNRTGDYIAEMDYGMWKRAERAQWEEINKLYPKDGTEETKEKRKELINKWHLTHSESVVNEWGYTVGHVPGKIYTNKEFKNLTDAQKVFYNEFMEIKKELDKLLPPDTTYSSNAIKIRKGLYDRVMTSNNANDLYQTIVQSVKDTFVERSDDTDIGRHGKTNLEGKEIYSIPIYFVNMSKTENANDLTSDLIGALIQYAYMAENYSAMNSIANVLELGKDVLHSRKTPTHRGNQVVTEVVEGFGLQRTISVPKTQKQAEELYQDMLDSQVYNIRMKDNGTFGKSKINKNKVGKFLLRMGSNIQLGLNGLAGSVNVLNGLAMQNIEAAAREYYSRKDLSTADSFYRKHLHEVIGEVGSRNKTNMVDLIFEFFDVKQDYDKTLSEVDFNKRNWIARMFGPAVLYLFQTMGDHFLYGRAALAMLNKYQVKKNGQTMSLLEALEKVPVDPKNPEYGMQISLKGIEKLDGSEFTREDVLSLASKINKINQKCFGVYNTEDVNAARRTLIGSFALQYRDWMWPAWKRRFGKAVFDPETNEEIEPYYTSAYKFSKQLIKDLKNGEFNLEAAKDKLTDHQKANLRRCRRELTNFVAILAMLALYDWWDDKDPDREKSWFEEYIIYCLRRLKTELGTLVPGPFMVTEGLKIMDDPIANTSILKSIANITTALWIPSWTDEIESGRFKGHSSGYRAIMKSPLTLNADNIYNIIYPEEAAKYFK